MVNTFSTEDLFEAFLSENGMEGVTSDRKTYNELYEGFVTVYDLELDTRLRTQYFLYNGDPVSFMAGMNEYERSEILMVIRETAVAVMKRMFAGMPAK